MRFCCLCIPLRDGVTVLGFFSLIICVLQWILATTLNPGIDILFFLQKNQTEITIEQLESLKSNSGLMLNCVTAVKLLSCRGKFHSSI